MRQETHAPAAPLLHRPSARRVQGRLSFALASIYLPHLSRGGMLIRARRNRTVSSLSDGSWPDVGALLLREVGKVAPWQMNRARNRVLADYGAPKRYLVG